MTTNPPVEAEPHLLDDPGNDASMPGIAPISQPLMAIRMRLPSELAQQPALRWPDDVSAVTHITVSTLKERKKEGDHPRLYAIGRAQFTTIDDVREWVLSHELAPGHRLRPATILKGSKVTASLAEAQRIGRAKSTKLPAKKTSHKVAA